MIALRRPVSRYRTAQPKARRGTGIAVDGSALAICTLAIACCSRGVGGHVRSRRGAVLHPARRCGSRRWCVRRRRVRRSRHRRVRLRRRRLPSTERLTRIVRGPWHRAGWIVAVAGGALAGRSGRRRGRRPVSAGCRGRSRRPSGGTGPADGGAERGRASHPASLVFLHHSAIVPVLHGKVAADVQIRELIAVKLRDRVWRQQRDHQRQLLSQSVV